MRTQFVKTQCKAVSILRNLRRGTALLLMAGLVATSAGCELIVDFDRSKIPTDAGSSDATAADAQSSDGAT